MQDKKHIAMPEPAGILAHEDGSGFVDCWTKAQMLSYAAQNVAAERERWERLICEALYKIDRLQERAGLDMLSDAVDGKRDAYDEAHECTTD